MRYVQCIMESQTSVLVQRAGLPRLAVQVFTPMPVPESEAERQSLQNPRRFIPLAEARRLVERGRGSWEWVLAPGESAPAAVLSGPLPEGFPYRPELIEAGFHALELLPTEMSGLSRIPSLVRPPDPDDPMSRPSRAQRERAAGRILDAIDALYRKE